MTEVEASKDTLQRRKRLEAQSTGKKVAATERDRLWFQKIHEHGPLSSSYLHAFSQAKWTNEKKAKERLTDLFNEDNTPHDGMYLTRPKQQFKTIDSRYNELVYDLSAASKRSLQEAGMWDEHVVKRSGPWLHQYMCSCITASVEIASLGRGDLKFIPASAILKRAETKLSYPIDIKWPGTEGVKTKDLIPDGLFGLEYISGEQSAYRFFVVEADRATEPVTSKNGNRKSYQRHVLQYRDYVGNGKYQAHLNLTAPVLVLNVSTEERKQEQFMQCVLDEAGSGGCNYQLFQTFDAFGEMFAPPKPNTGLLLEPWQRAGMEPIKIDQE